jgi:hypothetical protein
MFFEVSIMIFFRWAWGLNSEPNTARKHSTSGASPQPFFALGYFSNRVSRFYWGQFGTSYLCLPYSWNDRHTTYHPACFVEMGVSLTFFIFAWAGLKVMTFKQ